MWKLLYIFMLGYDVEFGHKQAADLIPANKCVSARALCCVPAALASYLQPDLLHSHCRYAEKQVGYMACAILLNEVRCMLIAWPHAGSYRAKLTLQVRAERRVHAAHHQLHT